MKFLYKLVSIGIKPEQANKVKFKTRVLNAIGLSTITIVLFYTIFYFMGGEDETFLIPLSSYLLTGISIVTLNYFNKADWTDYALHILFPISFVLSSVQLGNQLDVEYFLFLTGIGVLLNTATFSQRTRQVIFSVNLLLFISLKIYLIYQPKGLLTMNENSMPYLNLLNGVVIFTLLYFMISTMFNFSFRLLKKLQYVKSNQEKIIEERTQELKQKTQDLERSVSELERFSYIAAHDLREPLRTVKSFSQLAKRDIKKSKTDNLEEYLTYVEHGVNRLDVLTKDIVKYVEIEDLTQKKEEVIVSDLINGIVANLQKESHKKIELSLVGDSPVLMINEYLAYNLFENLITNVVENCDKPIVQITINIKMKMDNSYHFWIQDNGNGIEEKYYDLIFEMFKRLENNIHKSGSGIGLAICKKIVERHQGKIWVESEIGVGSTFHFTIKA